MVSLSAFAVAVTVTAPATVTTKYFTICCYCYCYCRCGSVPNADTSSYLVCRLSSPSRLSSRLVRRIMAPPVYHSPNLRDAQHTILCACILPPPYHSPVAVSRTIILPHIHPHPHALSGPRRRNNSPSQTHYGSLGTACLSEAGHDSSTSPSIISSHLIIGPSPHAPARHGRGWWRDGEGMVIPFPFTPESAGRGVAAAQHQHSQSVI